MKLCPALVAGLVLVGPAFAQTVPSIPRSGRDARNQPIIMPRDIEPVFGTKVDLGAPITLTGRVPAGCELTHSGTPNVVVDSSLCLTPPAEVPSTRHLYQINVNLVASPNNGTGDKVPLYSRVVHTGGQSSIWAFNTVTDILAPSNGVHAPSAAGYELDMDNADCDAGADPAGTPVTGCPTWSKGLWVTGLTGSNLYPVTDGILVTATGNGSLYHNGLRFLGPYVIDQTIYDGTNSAVSLRIAGNHGDGIDLSRAQFTGGAVRLANEQKVCFQADCNTYAVFNGPSDGVQIYTHGGLAVTFTAGATRAENMVVNGALENRTGAILLNGQNFRLPNLPTSDPHIVDVLYDNGDGIVRRSHGP